VKEVVNIAISESCDAHSVARTIPDDHARYHIFNFKHDHEGNSMESLGQF
jgi:twinfilin-like protein